MKRQLKDLFQPHGMKQLWTSGFTYVELAIVLLLVGIFAMIGFPALNATMRDSRLSDATQEAVNALEFAQLTAMTSGRMTRVVIGNSNERIEVRQYTINADLFNGGDELAEGDVENGTYEIMPYPPKKGLDYRFDFPDEGRFRGVDITISDFNNSDPVFFDAMGAPSKGGSATLTLGNSQRIVTLDALTGKVTVSQ
jgi:type II secretory pathway pseudopilin PulG